jgi:hypothetical protein
MASASKPTTPAPADDAPPPDTAPAAVETSGAHPGPHTEPTPDPAPEPGRYRFTGPYALTYMAPPSFVAEPGESYDWPAGPPADGRWIKEN